MIQPEFSIVINGQVFNGINDPQSGVDALFPESGEKSLEAVIAEYGDDLDAVMQSATFYRVAIGRNGYAVMEDADQQPFILSPEGEARPANHDREGANKP